ncbi:unnamed protein product [Callosobruchus maculatus]|uniref:Down syndrome cell adhesion molecule n=1 Tax=Callosobruchus maculatus TaxID=64391 RepID=A0A653D2L4_CALMS|nr:unnamed protein product [Callosobruchus maculatus]
MYRPRKTEKSLLVGKTCSSGRTKLHEPTNNLPPKLTGERTLGKILSFSQQSTAVLLCPVVGYPFPKFKWYKFIEGTNRKQAVTLDERVKQVAGTLIIREAKVEDSGKYLCVVNNSVGGESVETVLTVTAPLKAKIEPPVQTVDFGRPAVFTCKFEGNPIKTISWLKDGNKLDHSDAVLRIEAVRKEDKGMYQCFVRNDQESAEATAELKLGGRFEPPQIRHAFDTETVQPGNSVFLKCIASGNPTPEITWELYGRKLSNNEVYQIGQYVTVNGDVVSHLNISSIRTNDGGLYRCVASSKVGTTEHSARINVYGLPVVRSMEKQAIVAGGTLIVHCPFAGHPVDSVVWERDGRLLPINRKQKVFPNGTLIIENVERASDQATYVCVAKNSQGYSARGSLEVQVMVPPQIHPFDFGGEATNSGDIVVVICTITKGDYPIKMHWTLNGKPVTNTDGVTISSTNKRISQLTIESVQAQHSGEYTCIAENSAGTTKYSSYLNVNVLPQIIPFTFGDEAINSGDSTYLTCSVHKGDLPINFSWLHNNVSIGYLEGVLISKAGKKASTITIDSVQAVHSGVYTCVAENKAGNDKFSARLNVNAPPQIMPFNFGEESINSGDSTSVTCSIHKGDLPINFSWLHNNVSIGYLPGVIIGKVGKKTSTVSIDSVGGEHAGTYTCVAENKAGAARYSAVLNVNAPPQIMPFSFGEESINSGDSVSATCSIHKGDLPINISWLHNNVSIGYLPGVMISKAGKKVSTVTIDSVNEEHMGTYTCTAENKAGVARYIAVLNVNAPPQIAPFSFGEEPINSGDSTSVMCSIHKGDLPINISWLHNNVSIGYLPGVMTSKAGKKVSTVTIDSVTEEHMGTYTCIAENKAGTASYSAVLNVNVPPQMHPFDFGDESINSGEMASLTCSVHKGDLPMKIYWLHNNYSVADMDDILITKAGKKISTLSIDSVSAKHSGEYTCVAENKAGSSRYSAILNVNVPPQILPFDFGEDSVNAGELASLQCSVHKGDLPMKIYWLHNNYSVADMEDILISKAGKKISTLSIDSVSAKHSGEYTCVAENEAGSSQYSARLNVNVPPQITPFDFGEESMNSGDSISLVCSVHQGDLPINLSWLHNNVSIGYLDGVFVTKAGKKASTLTIDSVSAEHSGVYSCVAENRAGVSRHSSVLNVNVPPQITPFDFGEDTVNSGDSVSLVCTVHKGDQPINLSWLHNNVSIGYLEGVQITKGGKKASMLTIDSANEGHIGTYTCIAENKAGTSRHSAELNVNVPPKIHQFSFGDEPSFVRETVSVQCTVSSGDQPISFSWMFNGKPIRNEVGISVGSMSKKISYLTIDSVSEEHIGNYTCVAANRAGMSTFSTALVVKVLPRITPFGFEDSPVHSGQFVEVTCTVSEGDLPVQITWQLNGRDFDNFPEVTTTKVGKRTSVLSIESVSYANAGIYTCLARNRAGEAVFSAELQVNVPPQIVPFDFGNKPVHSGEFVQVYCTVNEGDLPLIIKWNLNGHHLDNFLDLTVAPVGRRASILSIESVSYEHVGNFTCIAKNRAGVARYSAQLQVNVTPQITAFDFGDGPVHSGQFVQVTCTAFEGDLPLKIEWLLNGRPLGDLSEVTVSTVGKRTSFLSIDSVSYAHAGNYTCRTKNRAGEAAYTSELQVNVPPRIVPFSFGDQVVNAGQATQATCLVSEGDLPLKITWSYDGNAADASFTTIKISPKASLLLIDAASETQAGNYSCTVTNAAGSVSFTASLDVYVPPRWILEPTDKAFAQGSDAVVECKADGFPKPVVTWKRATGVSPGDYRDFKPNNPDIKVEDGTLMINNIQKTNEGYYLCEANNGIGSGLSAVILISVQAPPQFEVKYRNQTAKRGDPAVLQCQAKGEKPIGILWNINNKRLEPKGDNRYTIREEILPDGVVSDLSIKRTERSDSAIFTCVATNAFGSDDTNINMIVQEAPEVPYGLKVLDKSGRSVQLSWVAPYDGNSPIKK